MLDNQYYKDMVDDSVTWTNEEITRSGKWQFSGVDSSGSDVGTRLNTDLVLAYDLTIADDNSCSCTIGTDCAQADSYDLVAKYAEVCSTVWKFWNFFDAKFLCEINVCGFTKIKISILVLI